MLRSIETCSRSKAYSEVEHVQNLINARGNYAQGQTRSM